MVGLFLALLELMRQARVRVSQVQTFDAIDVELLSRDPIQVGEEWGEAFADAVLGDKAQQATNDEALEALAAELHDREDAASSHADQNVMPRNAESDPTIAANLDEDDDDEAFNELDNIKTDVDVDAILRKGRGIESAERDPSENDE
jgi:hypothetical protein